MSFTMSRKVLFGALALAFAMAGPVHAQQKSVAITAIVEHPALDAVRDGVKEALTAAGYEDGKNLKWQYQSAQGNTGTAAQIARKFIGDKSDVIVAIATPSAQAVAAATKDIPLVYSAVTDPVAAKLVASMAPSVASVYGRALRLGPRACGRQSRRVAARFERRFRRVVLVQVPELGPGRGRGRVGGGGAGRGPEIPPSLRTRQKWIAMKITITNGRNNTCNTYHRNRVSEPISAPPSRTNLTSWPNTGV